MQIGRAGSAHLLSIATMPKKRLTSRIFSFTYVKSADSKAFITCSISKKALPRAVDRNRAKRRARAALLSTADQLKVPIIAIISLTALSNTVPFSELRSELERVLDSVI